jgi:HEAT repeat protein
MDPVPDFAPLPEAAATAPELDELGLGGGVADVASLDEALVQRLAAQFADTGAPDAGVAVLRDLLRIESRRPRFHRLLRVWVGKLTAAVRAGDLARAEAWMRALVTSPTYPAEFADLVTEALDEVSDPEVLDALVVHLAAAEPPGTGSGLVAAWGERLARYLVQGMAVDEPPVNRRYLVEFLAWVGRDDVRLLAALVADPRWYIVRNVAIALGRTGRPQAIPPLESLLDHPDHRVRVEALRGLFVLRRGESVASLVGALTDAEPRVRHAAVSMLRASPSREVVSALVDLLETRPPAPAEARRLVEVIAERSDPAVAGALARLAGRKRVMGSARATRDAAREMLAGVKR